MTMIHELLDNPKQLERGGCTEKMHVVGFPSIVKKMI